MRQSTITVPDFQNFRQEKNNVHKKRNLVFAHPVDGKIIALLDTPAVNEIFSRYIRTATDIQHALDLSTAFKVGPNNHKALYEILCNCSDILDIPVPYTVISNHLPGVNAQTAGTDEFAYVELSSLLHILLSTEEQQFVLGHELGHIALGHVMYHTVLQTTGILGGFIPTIGKTLSASMAYPLHGWSRRSEISADRAGLLCCRNVHTAQKALLKLEAGFLNVDDLDIEQYLQESASFRTRHAMGKFSELFRSHPIIPKRMEAIALFAQSEKYYSLIGETPPAGMELLTDSMLEKATEDIVKVL